MHSAGVARRQSEETVLGAVQPAMATLKSKMFAVPSESDLRSSATHALLAVEQWVRERDWRGYDPYDLQGSRLMLALTQSGSRWAGRVAGGLQRLMARFPRPGRKILGVRPHRNPKAMGLFLSGYVRLAAIDGQAHWVDYARQIARWLLSHVEPGYSGPCWGLPFDWQSVMFFPKGTPCATVSLAVGEGFWDLYKYSGNHDYLEVCRGICDFIIRDLNITSFEPRQICFSYTPMDSYLVHNANLMAAEFLTKLGSECGETSWVELGLQAAEYSLSDLNEDGSLYYWGRGWPERSTHRDVYHSGFEIRSFWNLWRVTRQHTFRNAAARYLHFFKNAYLRSDGAPVRNAFQFDQPLFDIHGCAEAILCLATLAGDFPDVRDDLDRTLNWTLANMQNRDGSWAYQIDHRGRIDRSPYMRWGQAWMFRALTEYLLAR